jgi:hypothetical protein
VKDEEMSEEELEEIAEVEPSPCTLCGQVHVIGTPLESRYGRTVRS